MVRGAGVCGRGSDRIDAPARPASPAEAKRGRGDPEKTSGGNGFPRGVARKLLQPAVGVLEPGKDRLEDPSLLAYPAMEPG